MRKERVLVVVGRVDREEGGHVDREEGGHVDLEEALVKPSKLSEVTSCS